MDVAEVVVTRFHVWEWFDVLGTWVEVRAVFFDDDKRYGDLSNCKSWLPLGYSLAILYGPRVR
jgi:hypothetical protein